ncbi:hypothetical protein LCGC14_2012630 [marine sediment metagenome]|uniref:ATP-grasp domain-containing protein n=1 Tax=marine sediment metagenome TaxID=412755 RepID=A0A0F9FMA9_9ZZZZ
MKFCVLVEGRYLGQRMPRDVVSYLWQAGHQADIVCSDGLLFDCATTDSLGFEACDAVISRDRSLMGLFLLAWAEKLGLPIVNPRAAIEKVRNKAEMTAALAAAGIPMPETVVCRTIEQLWDLRPSFFPFLVKPNFGDNAAGIQMVIDRFDLRGVRSSDDSVVVVQKFVPNDGTDLKLYVAGERVWAVRKTSPWPQNGQSQCSQVPLDQEMRSVALRCGHALGLDVYGVDALPTLRGIRVLEVNEFPNFTGVAAAPQAVADVLLARASGRRAPMSGQSRL